MTPACPSQMRFAILLTAMGFPILTVAETVLPENVVTATRSEHEIRTAPASISVVNAEELRTRNAVDLLDALRGTPGVSLMPRQVSGRKTISMRGMEGKHTLMLVDGRRIAASDDVVGHSDYQYGWVPMVAVERVEILRGASSALYGSEAMGGVVNIITRRPGKQWEGSVDVSGTGALRSEKGNRARAAVFAGGPLGDVLSLRFSGETHHADAVPFENDRRVSELEGSNANVGSLAATLHLTSTQELEADWRQGKERRFYDTSTRGQPGRPTVYYTSTYDLDRSQGGLAWRGRFDGWRSELRAYASEIDIVNSASKGRTPTRPQKMNENVVDGMVAASLGRHLLTGGFEQRSEKLKNDGLTGGSDQATYTAFFAQGEFALGTGLNAVVGLRSDHHQIFGNETSPRLYLVWEPNEAWVVKGGYGHSFKAPTLKQISPNYVGAEGPHTFYGNAGIKPEKSDSYEISADWKRDSLNVQATLFDTEIQDLIFPRLLRQAGPRGFYRFDNISEARIRGLENGLNWQFAQDWRLGANLTLLDTRDKTDGRRLIDRPKVAFSSRLDWASDNGWSARLATEIQGRMLVSKTETSEVEVPSYMLWHASIGKRFDKTFSLRGGIDNLTNVRLYDKSPDYGYSERGRTVYLTLRADV